MPDSTKVTALITRLGADGLEVCAFEHPLAGVQLPAGTLEAGEEVPAGALREAFEETGLAEVRFQSELMVLPATAGGAAARRHLVHLVCEGITPDEWFVVTPDGGGLCWRCHWLSVEDTQRLHPHQQPWLDLARPGLRQVGHPPARTRPVVEPEVRTDLTIELFWAPPWSASWARISWFEPQHGPPDDLIQRAEAVAFTEQAEVVAVAGSDARLWGLPGGRRAPGERLDQALQRELDEEACVRVVASELVGYRRFSHLSGERAGRVTTEALFWARAEVAPFEPRFETRHRRLLTLPEAQRLPLWRNPITTRLLERAAAAHARSATGRRRPAPAP